MAAAQAQQQQQMALAIVPAGGQQGAAATPALSLERQQQKAIRSRVLDHVGPYLRLIQARISAPAVRCVSHLQPVLASGLELLPPAAYPETPASSIGTKYVTTSMFRHRAAVNHLVYTPDGRRLLCAGNNGNVSLWNGSNFENELGPGIQLHEAAAIRCLTFSHSGLYLLSCDDLGRVKFSKPTLEVLNVIPAHKEPCRSVTFAPTDFKFATGSDDSTVRVFDTFRGQETSMTGHGGDVRWVDWHPTKGVIASCSKDACVKLWDPRRGGSCLTTLHGHKNGVFQVKWNRHNGNWLLTCSRDQLLKLYDVRMLKEVASFAGHGKDVTCCAWHPQHEELFVSGAVDGSLMFWLAGRPDAQGEGCIPAAHEAAVWSTAWHPLGHVLASAGADQRCQFWCRKRPGDIWQDSFESTQQQQPAQQDGFALAPPAAATAPGGPAGVAAGAGGAADGGSAGGGLYGGFGAGAAAGGFPGLGGGAGPGVPVAAAGAGRPAVIPGIGIGAVLDQLAASNLAGLMAASPPPAARPGAAPKRGREDGPRPARYNDRPDRGPDKERERVPLNRPRGPEDDRGPPHPRGPPPGEWGDRGDRGPPHKLPRMGPPGPGPGGPRDGPWAGPGPGGPPGPGGYGPGPGGYGPGEPPPYHGRPPLDHHGMDPRGPPPGGFGPPHGGPQHRVTPPPGEGGMGPPGPGPYGRGPPGPGPDRRGPGPGPGRFPGEGPPPGPYGGPPPEGRPFGPGRGGRGMRGPGGGYPDGGGPPPFEGGGPGPYRGGPPPHEGYPRGPPPPRSGHPMGPGDPEGSFGGPGRGRGPGRGPPFGRGGRGRGPGGPR